MRSGDFACIDYVGRVKDSGEIFDLTREDVAKKEGIYNPNFKYNPVTVIVDGEFLIKGLNEAIKEMEVGEKKTVDIPPEKAFGERNSEMIKLIPLAKFKEQNIDPVPGGFVTINRLRGRIVSVGGGRVRVDFNHPLAGKTLQYEIGVKSKITNKSEKVKAIVNYFTGIEKEEVEVVVNKEVGIKIKKKVDVLQATKELIAKNILRWIEGVEKVKFVDIFEKEDKAVEEKRADEKTKTEK